MSAPLQPKKINKNKKKPEKVQSSKKVQNTKSLKKFKIHKLKNGSINQRSKKLKIT